MGEGESDSRKRTLEALERRFASAKAELLRDHKKSTHSINQVSTPKSSDAKPPPPPPSSSSDIPKIGNFRFSGHATLQEIEEGGLAYAQLSHPVNENLLINYDTSSVERGSSLGNTLHELLRKGDSGERYMQGSRIMKIDNWVLLDNHSQKRPLSSGPLIRSKRSKKRMSMKQHKRHGTLDLPREFHKFDIFKPMHEIWKDYITRLLKNTGKNQNQLVNCLLSADLHGAIILVVECKITHFTGTTGIMIRETAETFGVITEDNKFRVVPKKVSVFVFQVDCWKVTLHGDKLCSRKIGL